MRRFLRVANLVALAALVGGALWAWPRLPAEIPLHFGLDGRPDRWGEATAVSWFLVPGIAVVLLGVFAWIRRTMTHRAPESVKLPDGRRLSDLPPTEREGALDVLLGVLDLALLEVIVILGMTQLASWRTANGQDGQGLVLAVLFIALLSGPVFLVILFTRLQGTGRPTSS